MEIIVTIDGVKDTLSKEQLSQIKPQIQKALRHIGVRYQSVTVKKNEHNFFDDWGDDE